MNTVSLILVASFGFSGLVIGALSVIGVACKIADFIADYREYH